MLLALGGHTHHVLTAVALAMPGTRQVAVALSDTAVTMRAITPDEAAAYWDSGEPAGKAGGYAIQGLGAQFISRIDGSHSGVMGLPLYETAQLLQSHGLYGVFPDEH
jgi:septum formation protein